MAVPQAGKEVLSMKNNPEEKGRKVVYCRYIVRNGKYVYPKRAKCFRFTVGK